METVTTSKGQILFREGDLALTMYVIKAGSVGVYTDYGTSGEKQIAVLKQDDFLGEMGMIEGLPRNATAVILEDATVLTELNEEDLALFFRNRPDQIIRIMRQLSSRIREIDGRFYSACHALRESEAASQSGTGKSDDLNRQLREISGEVGPHISLSVGVAFGDLENPRGTIFQDADTALYRMKEVRRCECAIY